MLLLKSANQNVRNNVDQNIFFSGSNARDEDDTKSDKELPHTLTVLVSSSDENVPKESSHARSKLSATDTRKPLRDCLHNVVEPHDALPVLDTPVCIAHKASKIDASISYPEPADHVNKRLKPTRPVKHTPTSIQIV
ncbi:hypothetical protein C2845_PM18G05750 [Panicum miliaceum]|uniref:Uncharacterized protein n=1 Tax=Panicum miliaceum TaxID=4540 RepID=A0A3L6PJH9_PANMI|nr:hypothetical protein C2845_PM18G05750 [Panicum miliaceum]